MDTTEQPDTFDQENATSVGELLKATRLNSGEELKDIASVLRINYTYLEAIEEGHFELLPGATYSLGFVRAYSEYLGLESSEVTSQLKSQESVRDVRVELDFPKPIPEASVPGAAVIFIGIIISFVAYGAWYFNSSKDDYISDMIASLPDRFSGSFEQTKIPKETKFNKKDQNVDNLKKDPKIDKRVSLNPIKENMKLIENVKPPLQMNAKKVLNQTEQSGLVQQPKIDVAPSKKNKSYPVPQLKSENSLNSMAKLLNESTISNSVDIEDNSESVPEIELSAKINSFKTDDIEPPLKLGASQTFVPGLKKIETPATRVMPSVKNIIASKTTPAVDTVREVSVVPVDIIPLAVPSKTLNVKGESNIASVTLGVTSQSATENSSSKAVSSSDSKKELLEATPIFDLARIVIKARTTSWIQVRDDTANEILMTRLLREGDSYNVPKRTGLMLSAGNAGALDIFVDGKEVPSIGGIGDVRREVLLDAAKLKAGTAVDE